MPVAQNGTTSQSSLTGSSTITSSNSYVHVNGHDNTITAGSSKLEMSAASVERESDEMHPVNPLSLHLLSHPTRGRGVFTSKRLPAGALIEESPVLVMSEREWEDGKMNDTILGSYGFCWRQGGMAIGLGLASLFNHSPTPNVNFVRNYDQGLIRFTTSKTIEAGEELCICYTADESKLWFVPQAKSTVLGSGGEALTNGHVHGHEGGDASDKSDFDIPNGLAVPDDLADLYDDDTAEARAAKAERKKERAQRLHEVNEIRRRDWRKAQGLLKKSKKLVQAQKQNEPGVESSILSPTPVPHPLTATAGGNSMAASASTSSSSSDSGSGSGSGSGSQTRSSTPLHTLPERSIPAAALPPPLHSTKGLSRHQHDGPVVLDPELDWDEEHLPISALSLSAASGSNWQSQSRSGSVSREGSVEDGDGAQWTGVERIKGYTEREEDAERNDESTIDIWAVEVDDPKLTREILQFTKEVCSMEPAMRHLKRVARDRDTDGPVRCRIALCTVQIMDSSELLRQLTAFSPSLSSLSPYIAAVPRSAVARSSSQPSSKALSWPITYPPPLAKPDSSSRFWSLARRTWAEAGIRRVISLALEAKARGEVPIAVFCTSPPSSLWPKIDDGFIPPTPGLRASAMDTRRSESHPLRHAALNCIASIARLRTVPPFSEIIPTRNGEDYLLTSMSLFMTHAPCVLCSMALLHSRVREVFYVIPNEGGGGGCEGEFGIHARKDLNHKYEVWRWKDVEPGVVEALKLDKGVEV